jgi:hypothetical protein
MQLARWSSSDATPKFDIRYSLDSGGSYTTLFTTNGAWFGADKAYQTFDSGPLSLIPASGQQIYIEIFRSTGGRMLMDNFEVDYIPTGGSAPQTPPTLNAIGNKAVTISNTLQFAVTATPTDGDTVTLTASNLPSGAVFGSTNEIGTFTWTNASPTNIYSVTFNAADDDGADNETITITVNPAGGGGGGDPGSFTNILFQGFEPGDGWSITAGSGNISTNNGAAEFPPNQRVRTGHQLLAGHQRLQRPGSGLGLHRRIHRTSGPPLSVQHRQHGNPGLRSERRRARLCCARWRRVFRHAWISMWPAASGNNARWGYWATNTLATTAGIIASNQSPPDRAELETTSPRS